MLFGWKGNKIRRAGCHNGKGFSRSLSNSKRGWGCQQKVEDSSTEASSISKGLLAFGFLVLSKSNNHTYRGTTTSIQQAQHMHRYFQWLNGPMDFRFNRCHGEGGRRRKLSSGDVLGLAEGSVHKRAGWTLTSTFVYRIQVWSTSLWDLLSTCTWIWHLDVQ